MLEWTSLPSLEDMGDLGEDLRGWGRISEAGGVQESLCSPGHPTLEGKTGVFSAWWGTKPCSPLQGAAFASALTASITLSSVFQAGQGRWTHLWEVPRPSVVLGVALDEQKERENVEP